MTFLGGASGFGIPLGDLIEERSNGDRGEGDQVQRSVFSPLFLDLTNFGLWSVSNFGESFLYSFIFFDEQCHIGADLVCCPAIAVNLFFSIL